MQDCCCPPIIDSKASKVQAEMHEQTIDTDQAVVDARRRANKTRIAADKAVAELRGLRDGGNASKTEIDTARQKVTSIIKKAAKYESRAILIEDDAKASPQQEVAPAEVAADKVVAVDTIEKLDGDSDGYDDAPFGDDNDSLGSLPLAQPQSSKPA